MKIFSKKEKLVENLAFFAIMAAMNIIFVLLANFFFFITIFLVFFLNFSSAFVALLCKKRYYIIYVLATIGICLLININDTLFFVIPSMITGFIFSFVFEKKMPVSYLLMIISFIQIVLTYISYLLIDLIYSVSIIDSFFIVFKLTAYEYKEYLIAPFIFLISFGQIIISYIILSSELQKFGFEPSKVNSTVFSDSIGIIFSILIMVASAFLIPQISYLFLILSLWFAVNILIYLFHQRNALIVAFLIILVILFTFLFAIFYPLVPSPFQLFSIGILSLGSMLIGIINKYLLMRGSKDKID